MSAAWTGDFTLSMQANARSALGELTDLEAFMATAAFQEVQWPVNCAVSVAWVQAKKSLALHRGCIADFCAPWFDGSDFLPRFSFSDREGITRLDVMLECNRDDPEFCEWLRTAPMHAEFPIGGGEAAFCVVRREA